MQNSSPLLDVPLTADDTFQSCDSPSGSSTSEPHDDSMNLQQPFIDQSFFYKLDQLSPDNPLFFMQQTQQQPNPEVHSSYEDQPMPEAEPDTPMDTPSPATQPMTTSSTPAMPSVSTFPQRSIIEPLQPATTSAPESNQTFWSGFNNFFSNVAHNPFPQAIPNLARNFTEYLSTYPMHFSNPTTSVSPAPPTTQTLPGTMDYKPFKQEGGQLHSDDAPGMQIRVLGVPQTGAKSRVETQIKLCIQLVTGDGDKAQWWSHLKLPEHMVAKDKLKRQIMLSTSPNGSKIASIAGLDNSNLPIKPEKMLFLSARVICASDPSRKVVTCLGCIQRERKRSQRRKENKIKTETDEEKRQVDDEKSVAQEEQKISVLEIQFCQLELRVIADIIMKELDSGKYCFVSKVIITDTSLSLKSIYFEMHDHAGKQVATGMSPPIMITDDHKSNKVKAGRKRPRTESESLNAQAILPGGSYPLQQTPSSSLTSSRFTLPLNNTPNLQSLRDQQFSMQPRPMTNDMMNTDMSRPATMMHQKHIDVVGPNAISRPSQIVNTTSLNQELLNMVVPSTTKKSPIPSPQPAADRPQLQRLIPSEGPTYGGIEVTILGCGFRPGLTCLFGEVAAATTHYWSPNTLVCILPPAVDPGAVVVSFKEFPLVIDSQDVTLFTYYNENDRALMELALQVVGLKMTGKVEDAREIAMRIVQGGNQNQQSGSTTTGGSGQQGQQRQMCLEKHIMQVLEVMNTMEYVESADMSLTNGQGHTMLHLASILGFSKLTRSLLDLGCVVDIADRNGYTALHFAAQFGHKEVVKILLDYGNADPEIPNLWSKKAVELSKNDDVRSILLDYESLTHDSLSDSCRNDSSSDMGADVDTDLESDDAGSIWLDSDTEERENFLQRTPQAYYSDSSTSSEHVRTHFNEGLRQRRRQKPAIGSIQYLQEDDGILHSADEILDAEAIHDHEGVISSDEEHRRVKSTWMQRTLSHFQQHNKEKSLPSATDVSFLQNLKNNMPTKPTDLNLKTITDHLLQLPRPTAMIANMSVLFSNDHNKSGTNEPEQALAWYMALAYAMGAGSRSMTEESPAQQPNRKQAHAWNYSDSTSTSPAPASSSSSTYDHSDARYDYPDTVDKKRRDRRLFVFWVPLLCCKFKKPEIRH
ncbi:SPT3 Dosage dependent suppressor of Ty-induced promoter mutations-like protein [Apophysomyces ossiformis]|uniref:SPT3 Dosage dependent suppressor of Ty-induced promoter mutations-like protein n=1 Tax=Apophysomyces ossiformis TaxID=679940 RepID=A0A8H7EMD9_9FUNG|nr:SPT3 Dosage dependent suppressor of Ty-induced promoter mutations-like protein [Apophysomyces ossiformis]